MRQDFDPLTPCPSPPRGRGEKLDVGMNWETLKARLLSRRGRRTGSFLLPSVVLDMQPGFVAGARLDRSSRQVRRVAVRQLEAGALEPFPSRPNLAKQEVVRRAIREVLKQSAMAVAG